MDLCLTLAEVSPRILEEKIARYVDQVPYIEVRLDYLEKPQIPALPGDCQTQFIGTCRPVREGGRFESGENARLKLLQDAAHSGFVWIDLEHDVCPTPDFPSTTRILRSFHCFDGFTDDLASQFQNLQTGRGDAVKLAVSVTRTEELVRLLRWMETLSNEIPFIILGMNDLGQPSRFLSAFLGNQWTYVAENGVKKVAPGQFTLREAREAYRLDQCGEGTQIYGIIGNPVVHSLSPAIHNRLFRHYDLNKVYLPLLLDDAHVWMKYVGESVLPFRGLSVTLPFKTDVLRFVKGEGESLPALNTLIRTESGWEGINTDYAGFLKTLKSSVSLQGKRVIVLGNGGVAHTVVKALQDEGAEVIVIGRNTQKVSKFAGPYGCSHLLFSDLPVDGDICVNTTPVGQYPSDEESPLQEDHLNFEVVYDLIYHPKETRLLEMARARDLRAISGIEMFVEQAALQFAAWTGISPDRELMKEIVSQEFMQIETN